MKEIPFLPLSTRVPPAQDFSLACLPCGAQLDSGTNHKTHDWLMTIISDVLLSCYSCQLQHPWPSQLECKLILPKHVFHTVSIDIVGSLPCSCSENGLARATNNVTAGPRLVSYSQDIFTGIDVPKLFLSGNETNFNARLITSIVEVMSTHHFLAPYNSSTNGMVERTNFTPVIIMRKLTLSNAANWYMFLLAALLCTA
ncbi:hypothetical protein DSO57_1027248 [Entomophthora muscae]|uniref:Uncharacterized protein n=1 Tax=Entomophthora muscae TaxID=34485 RepID=A0ACC2TPD7_9FUNG|nr:hypothetical protein DSO57_1027248 [Entomophthora muscae]